MTEARTTDDIATASTSHQSPGPSTPVKEMSNALDQSNYYNGVPGAPDRKLRSHGRDQDNQRLQRQAKVKSIAKLLDFGQERHPSSEDDEIRQTKARKIAKDSRGETSKDGSSLASPIHLQKKKEGKSYLLNDPYTQRTCSSSASQEDLLGFSLAQEESRTKNALPRYKRRSSLASISSDRPVVDMKRTWSSTSSQYQSRTKRHSIRTAVSGDPFLVQTTHQHTSCLSSASAIVWHDGLPSLASSPLHCSFSPSSSFSPCRPLQNSWLAL
jgi:hypothetical protein